MVGNREDFRGVDIGVDILMIEVVVDEDRHSSTGR